MKLIDVITEWLNRPYKEKELLDSEGEVSLPVKPPLSEPGGQKLKDIQNRIMGDDQDGGFNDQTD